MNAVSAATRTVSRSVMAAPATGATLSSRTAYGSSETQRLGALRVPKSSNRSRVVAVSASHTSKSRVKSKALVALVSTGAAFALCATPIPTSSRSAIAFDLNSVIDNVKELSNNISSSEGEEGKSTAAKLARQAAQQAARDFASGDSDTKTNRLLDNVKELAGNVSNLEGNQEAKENAIGVAKTAARGAVTDAAQDSNSNTASNLFETVKTLSGKIPGLDAEKEIQNAAVDTAKGAAKGAASNAARNFAENAKNNIGVQAGKAIFNQFTGDDK